MKIAYTGAQGTGKTTSVYNSLLEYKKNNKDKRVTLVIEVASESPFPINRKTTRESQTWIFTSQIKEELEKTNKYDIVVCDRTICDCIAYSMWAGFDDLAHQMIEFAKGYINTYDIIYFKKIENNNYNFSDGIRDTNDEYRQKMEDLMIDVYKKVGVYDKLIFC